MRTREQFVESLKDGRAVYFKGERVDVTAHPFFKPVINHLGLEFEIPEDLQYRDLVTFSPDGKARYSRR